MTAAIARKLKDIRERGALDEMCDLHSVTFTAYIDKGGVVQAVEWFPMFKERFGGRTNVIR